MRFAPEQYGAEKCEGILYTSWYMKVPKLGAKIATAVMGGFLLSSFLSIPNAQADNFQITDAKTCQAIDKDRTPLKVTETFPSGTSTVRAWFAWTGGKPGLQITARWYFDMENTLILNYPFTLTRASDKGFVALTMPPGRTFPEGSYHLDFEADGKVVRSIAFRVA